MYDLTLLIIGLVALSGVVLPLMLRDRVISYPLIMVGIGVGLAAVAFEPGTFDPIAQGVLIERLAEFAVIIALTGLGVSIDRRVSLRGWATTWRLLAITMPLTIAASAWLGWWAIGLAPATAMLFAAALAPTDPVLANDVQIGPPTTGAPDADEADEVRFALTSESSLNDGLAFPFTYLAVLMASLGVAPENWLGAWLLRDVLYRIAAGVALGWVAGKLLSPLVLKLWRPGGQLGNREGYENPAPALLALAITLVSYGATELAQGYGFIAVFVTASVIRDAERTSRVHDHLHEGAEQLERMALGVILLLFGAALFDGLAETITPAMVGAALVLVLVIRPAAGWVGLIGTPTIRRDERAVISVFGIRGLGTIYYLAYGLNHAQFLDAEAVWGLTAATILVSLLVHGLGARPVMAWLDERRTATPTAVPRDRSTDDGDPHARGPDPA